MEGGTHARRDCGRLGESRLKGNRFSFISYPVVGNFMIPLEMIQLTEINKQLAIFLGCTNVPPFCTNTGLLFCN